MKLLLDEQQARRVAESLRREGHDVIAVEEHAALRSRPDREVLEMAVAERRTLVTEDARDFAVLHRLWLDEGRSHRGIVLTSRRRFPRRRDAARALLAGLRSLLRAHPGDDTLRDQLIWLA